MTNRDRVKVIQDVLGFRIESVPNLPEERITKAAQRLELLRWSDFPNTYQEPPLKITTYKGGRVTFYSLTGQKSPDFCPDDKLLIAVVVLAQI
jgi:hypothetical protein